MKTIKVRFVDIISYFFILLFCYATVSKIMDFENFQAQIGQSPLISSFTAFGSYGILITEILVCLLLLTNKTRIYGLYGSFMLMVLFSVYIYLILNYSEFVPCSCGGILEKMDWHTHLWFNISCFVLAAISILLHNNDQARNYFFKIILLLTMLCFCVLLMFFIHKRSEVIMRKDNGFVRRFLPHAVIEEKRFDLGINSYYFAGISSDTIYLGSITAPFTLSKLVDFKTLREQFLKPSKYDDTFFAPMIEVKNNQIFLSDGTVPIIYKGSVHSDQLKVLDQPQFTFQKISHLADSSFVVTAYHRKQGIQSLGIYHPGREKHVLWNPKLLEKVKDGYFDPDGHLHYDSSLQKLVYVYLYKNKYITTDLNLNLKDTYRTIDTVTVPQLDIVYSKNQTRKLGGKTVTVNKRSAVHHGILFIQSDRIGKYEHKELWKKMVTVDMYSIVQQKYIGSFYLPKKEKQQRMQFIVDDKNLYLIVENEIIKYRFAQNITQHFISGVAENLNKE
ncbi:hypothetical protein PGH12_01415 [Chryseobacterium wangxinyae]|uniref:MauE/DoxX family redox-associated membrane protein n=1 Tax=Chryseobacterium sp. CY350 TaxID=2997336 RepID=UPI00226F11D0|nr:MauE/DoxX family redox-associated membrane protein [Chryseobacterium sp. CY350]MCY0977160.1 hypothetical protein [Chryseobacterium sp. CY350]WBZ95819.1 hypothetical protein PGH12_01415 [Chryseobacterium sp. CY350]